MQSLVPRAHGDAASDGDPGPSLTRPPAAPRSESPSGPDGRPDRNRRSVPIWVPPFYANDDSLRKRTAFATGGSVGAAAGVILGNLVGTEIDKAVSRHLGVYDSKRGPAVFGPDTGVGGVILAAAGGPIGTGVGFVSTYVLCGAAKYAGNALSHLNHVRLHGKPAAFDAENAPEGLDAGRDVELVDGRLDMKRQGRTGLPVIPGKAREVDASFNEIAVVHPECLRALIERRGGIASGVRINLDNNRIRNFCLSILDLHYQSRISLINNQISAQEIEKIKKEIDLRKSDGKTVPTVIFDNHDAINNLPNSNVHGKVIVGIFSGYLKSLLDEFSDEFDGVVPDYDNAFDHIIGKIKETAGRIPENLMLSKDCDQLSMNGQHLLEPAINAFHIMKENAKKGKGIQDFSPYHLGHIGILVDRKIEALEDPHERDLARLHWMQGLSRTDGFCPTRTAMESLSALRIQPLPYDLARDRLAEMSRPIVSGLLQDSGKSTPEALQRQLRDALDREIAEKEYIDILPAVVDKFMHEYIEKGWNDFCEYL